MNVFAYRVMLLFVMLAFMGCAKQAIPRPSDGDTVSTALNVPNTWEAGQGIILSAKLRVQGPNDARPIWLTHEDVPHDGPPRMSVTFWRGEELLKSFTDVALAPEC